MQQISFYNFSVTNRYNIRTNPSFTGAGNAVEAVDNILSPKSMKLVKRGNELIENTWTEIKKGRSKLNSPEFLIEDKNKNSKIRLKPLYNTAHDTLLLEVTGPKYIDKIIVDRKHPNIFRYEKVLITENGSATVKSYNSENSRNSEIIAKVNEIIEKYLPKFFPKERFTKESILG